MNWSQPVVCLIIKIFGKAFALALFLLICFEVIARIYSAQSYYFATNVGAFKQPHPTRGVSLVPGWEAPGISINSLGLLGPEIEIEPGENELRILVIGDSVSFSPPDHNYPTVLERILRERHPGVSIRVICGAVPGYSSSEALTWYRELLYKLRANITILYLGWNDLGQYHPFGLRYKNEGLYTQPTIVGNIMRFSYALRASYFLQGLLERYRPVDWERLSSSEEDALQAFEPTVYQRNLMELIELNRANGSKVFLMSLAGLITHMPTDAEARRMHFPRGIGKKVMLYKRLFEIYSKALGKAATETNTPLIDLSLAITTPTDRLIFTDTMHINRDGAERFALVIANNLAPEMEVLLHKHDDRIETAPSHATKVRRHEAINNP